MRAGTEVWFSLGFSFYACILPALVGGYAGCLLKAVTEVVLIPVAAFLGDLPDLLGGAKKKLFGFFNALAGQKLYKGAAGGFLDQGA